MVAYAGSREAIYDIKYDQMNVIHEISYTLPGHAATLKVRVRRDFVIERNSKFGIEFRHEWFGVVWMTTDSTTTETKTGWIRTQFDRTENDGRLIRSSEISWHGIPSAFTPDYVALCITGLIWDAVHEIDANACPAFQTCEVFYPWNNYVVDYYEQLAPDHITSESVF